MNEDTKEQAANFPKRLKEARMQKGFSQKEFAEKVGLHSVHYGRFERGESMPSSNTLAKLADALNVSSDYLLEGKTKDAAIADFEDKELLEIFKETEQLSDEDKVFVKRMLRAFLNDARLKKQYAS